MNTENKSTEPTGFASFPAPGAGVLTVRDAVAQLGGSWDAYRDVGLAFLDHMPGVLRQLEAHVGAPDLLRHAVHEAGGSLGAVGAMQAQDLARAFEARLRRGGCVDVEALCELRGAIDVAVAAVRALGPSLAEHGRPLGDSR